MRSFVLPVLLALVCAPAWSQTAACTLTPIMGTPLIFGGDGGPASQARLNEISDVAYDSVGNLYIADSGNHRIRKVSPAGVITTIAGTGTAGFNGDGIPAVQAHLRYPIALAVDQRDNLYVADFMNHRVGRIGRDGVIQTIAGTGIGAFNQDQGPATATFLDRPRGLAFDHKDRLYISDSGNHRVRRLDPDGTLVTVAGNGRISDIRTIADRLGDGGPALQATVLSPAAITTNPVGDVLVFESGRRLIRRIAADGTISTVVGSLAPDVQFPGSDTNATTTAFEFHGGLRFGPGGRLHFSANNRVWQLDADGSARTVYQPFSGEAASSLTFDRDARLVYTRYGLQVVAANEDRRGLLLAGNADRPGASTGQAAAVFVRGPMMHDSRGNLYILITGTSAEILRLDPQGQVTKVAGSSNGVLEDGSPATATRLRDAYGLAVDPQDRLLITQSSLGLLRRIRTDGIVETVLGSGRTAFTGTPIPVSTASGVSQLTSVGVDSAGNIMLWTAGQPGGYLRIGAADSLLSSYSGAVYTLDPALRSTGGSLYIPDSSSTRILRATPTGWQPLLHSDNGLRYGSFTVDPEGTIYSFHADALWRIRPGGSPAKLADLTPMRAGGFGPEAASVVRWTDYPVLAPNGDLLFQDAANRLLWRLTSPAHCPALPVPIMSPGGIVDAASYGATDTVVPGQLIAVFGNDLGPVEGTGALLNSEGKVRSSLADRSLLFDGTPAPLLYSSANLLVGVVPFDVAGKETVQVSTRLDSAAARYPRTVRVLPANPSLFTANASGQGQAAALNQDGTPNSATNPASPGSVIVLYLTGLGQTDPPGVDGQLTTGPTLPRPIQPVTVTIGGQPALVEYAGNAPSLVAGISQINARIPTSLPAGDAVVEVTAAGRSSAQQQRVTITVR